MGRGEVQEEVQWEQVHNERCVRKTAGATHDCPFPKQG